MDILEVKNLTIRFGGVVAVNNVSFNLEKGQTLGVIGPNGSGKTTLFNMLSGIYYPDNGQIFINGKESAESTERLKVLENSNDGFYIAEEDLRRRGPGELLGVRQSGVANFNFVNLVNDFKMFECARDDAAFILKNQDQPGFARILTKARLAIEKENNLSS